MDANPSSRGLRVWLLAFVAVGGAVGLGLAMRAKEEAREWKTAAGPREGGASAPPVATPPVDPLPVAPPAASPARSDPGMPVASETAPPAPPPSEQPAESKPPTASELPTAVAAPPAVVPTEPPADSPVPSSAGDVPTVSSAPPVEWPAESEPAASQPPPATIPERERPPPPVETSAPVLPGEEPREEPDPRLPPSPPAPPVREPAVELQPEPPAPRVVPDVLGLPRGEAQARLRQAGFRARLLAGAPTTSGIVIRQSPSAGSTSDAASEVELAVGSPQGDGRVVPVPDVADLLLHDAVTLLVGKGFLPLALPVASTAEGLDRVGAQTPRAGASARTGGVVRLEVGAPSHGEQADVPSVVGLTRGEASERLSRAGFSTQELIVVRVRPGVFRWDADSVVAQWPSGRVPRGAAASVTMWIIAP